MGARLPGTPLSSRPVALSVGPRVAALDSWPRRGGGWRHAGACAPGKVWLVGGTLKAIFFTSGVSVVRGAHSSHPPRAGTDSESGRRLVWVCGSQRCVFGDSLAQMRGVWGFARYLAHVYGETGRPLHTPSPPPCGAPTRHSTRVAPAAATSPPPAALRRAEKRRSRPFLVPAFVIKKGP